jgi:site-specific DNA recombinase
MSKARKINSSANGQEDVNDLTGRVGLVYNRVSSKRQETEGSGLTSQRGRCIDFLKGIGVPYEETFADSYSGGGDFMNRPQMRAMLAYIDTNAHKRFVVVFDDISRFARDVFFHIKLRTEFKKRDVVLKCLNYNFDESEEGEYAELIFAGKAELDRKQNRRQVIQKQKARLELGYWAFGAKRGYKMVHNPIHGKLLMRVDPDGEILKTALEGFASGRFQTKVDVCRFMVENGFWRKQKPERYIDKLTSIMIDPLYAGYIEYPVWGVTRRKGHHQGIIDLQTFDLIQKRLNSGNKGKRVRIDTREDFPLRGLITCEEGNSSLTGAISKGRSKSYAYYFCQKQNCSCGRHSTPAEEMHKSFDILLQKQKAKDKTIKLTEAIFDAVWSEETKNINMKLMRDQFEVRKLEDDLEKYLKCAVDAKSDQLKQIYEMKMEECSEKINQLKAISDIDVDHASVPYRTALEKALLLIKSPYKIWHSVDAREKQRLFHFIFLDKLPYSKKAGYRTDNLPSAVRLFEDFVTSNSQDVEMAEIESASE